MDISLGNILFGEGKPLFLVERFSNCNTHAYALLIFDSFYDIIYNMALDNE